MLNPSSLHERLAERRSTVEGFESSSRMMMGHQSILLSPHVCETLVFLFPGFSLCIYWFISWSDNFADVNIKTVYPFQSSSSLRLRLLATFTYLIFRFFIYLLYFFLSQVIHFSCTLVIKSLSSRVAFLKLVEKDKPPARQVAQRAKRAREAGDEKFIILFFSGGFNKKIYEFQMTWSFILRINNFAIHDFFQL